MSLLGEEAQSHFLQKGPLLDTSEGGRRTIKGERKICNLDLGI